MIGPRAEPDEIVDPYATLQVRPDADPVVIQAAYRALMRRHHPDRGGSPAMAARLNAAYALLRDPRARPTPARPAPGAAPRALGAELRRALLEHFSPVVTDGPGWLFDFAGVLRSGRRHRIWMRRFHRQDLADARAFHTMIEATRLTRPLWRWGSDLFVAVLLEMSPPFAAVLRPPGGWLPRVGHAVVALELGARRVHAPAGSRRLPSLAGLHAAVAAAR
jgi:hypothetical protein